MTIKVSTPGSDNLIEVNSDATTWGELKDVLNSRDISTDGMKGIIRETKITLESDEAQLPDDNFTLFLFTAKVKSGLDTAEMLRDLRNRMDEAFDEMIDDLKEGVYGDDSDGAISDLKKERDRLARELTND
jgi:hypothetical protein